MRHFKLMDYGVEPFDKEHAFGYNFIALLIVTCSF